MDAELQSLKTLPLETYAVSLGFVRDSEKSTNRVAVLRRDADKLLVTQGNDGHWIYRNERNHDDHGSILDFVMRQQGVNLGEARKQLRAWANLPFHPAPESVRMSELSDSDKTGQTGHVPLCPDDRQRLQSGWNKSTWNQEPDYLLSRLIPRSVLNDARFRDCWRISSKGAVLFPHRDLSGLCGLEIRGDKLKVFSKGGKKGLWLSANIKAASRIVITESPIDALSFHALHVDATDAAWPLGYAAFGGGLGNRQKALLGALISRSVDRGAEIITATDNDLAGDEYAESLQLLSPVELKRITPIDKDFNADLAWCVREDGGEQWS